MSLTGCSWELKLPSEYEQNWTRRKNVLMVNAPAYIGVMQVLDGVMFNKDVTHSKMRRRIENPRILLLDCPLEYKKGEVGDVPHFRSHGVYLTVNPGIIFEGC